MDRYTTIHREDAECRGRHCESCYLDELGAAEAHTVCPKCNHVYPTEEHLLADYLGLSMEKLKAGWKDYQNIKTLYCPKCRHIWGKREKN